ncbi:hypothetical protein MRU69_11020 [Kocuria flava]|uniref:hypothetical protein n=1 Tax=Kocuria flava TaxID=446860 RepID=UPI001FF45AB8|nr:hypothetical protein [Kocuria flava]MCJ8505383.1 hypothetical protein [Kocuria flava]
MSTHGHEPEYGQRLSPEQLAARAAARPAAPRTTSPRAARRMVRGLSFTLVLLGLLLGAGLTAAGAGRWAAAGLPLVLAGAAGFTAVQTQLHPALRDPGTAPLRSRSKLWLIPAALLAAGAACLAAVFAVAPAPAGTPEAALAEQWVSVLVVSGATLVVAAGLGAGLVATTSFTRPDDDDSPLRPTGYAERLRRRPAPSAAELYDPGWVSRARRHGRRDEHGTGPDGGPGGRPPGQGGPQDPA